MANREYDDEWGSTKLPKHIKKPARQTKQELMDWVEHLDSDDGDDDDGIHNRKW
jgi:hypothetical protein